MSTRRASDRDGSAGSPVSPPSPPRGTRPAARSLRHIDPSGKQALFSSRVVAAPDQLGPGNQKEGRAALFSTGPRQPGTVIVECSACHARARCTLLDLGIRLLSISAWLPTRRHSHWMRCPSCNQHTWCAIGWTD